MPGNPAVVAWIVRELFSHAVEEYVLAISGFNPSRDGVLIVQKWKHFVSIRIAGHWAAINCCL